jgi:hypothetical protein
MKLPRGLRGWETTPPLGPGSPLYDSVPIDPGLERKHIFASVPELDFAWRRETFGQHSTVVEKMQLLARPRSLESTHALAKLPRRCYMMQVVRGEMARAMIRQQKADSPGSSSIEPLVPRAQWMLDTPPYATKEEADQLWRQGTRTLFGSVPSLSSSSFTGGNTLKVLADIEHPSRGREENKLALDTQSDVTSLRDFLSDIRPILPDIISGCGGATNFEEEGILSIYSSCEGRLVQLPALVASPYQLPLDCIALLGVPALLGLEVAVDQHLSLPRFSPLVCHLGEKRLREWLTHHPNGAVDTSPFDLEHIQINPALTADQIARVKAVILKFAKVFEGHQNSLPKPFATDPIVLKLKADAKHQSIPQPRWTVTQKEIVTQWADEGLRNGSLP